jgi:hypothetical protein
MVGDIWSEALQMLRRLLDPDLPNERWSLNIQSGVRRALLGFGGTVALFMGVWVSIRISAFSEHSLGDSKNLAFIPIGLEKLQNAFEQSHARMRLSATTDLQREVDLFDQLVTTKRRSTISENVQLSRRLVERTVRADYAMSRFDLGDRRIVLTATPRKSSSFRAFRTLDPPDAVQLTFRETQALLYAVATTFIESLLVVRMPAHIKKDLVALLNLRDDSITAFAIANKTRGRKKRADDLADDIGSLSGIGAWSGSPEERLLRRLLEILSERRPILLDVPSQTTRISFVQSEGHLKFDKRWLTGKSLHMYRRVRRRLYRPQRIVSIPISRAQNAWRYNLRMYPPTGMYFREARVWDYDLWKWMPSRLVRELNYARFVGVRLLSDASQLECAITASPETVPKVDPLRNPRIAVRMSEVPPGSILTSLILCLSVTLAVWWIGNIPPDSPLFTSDIAAFLLALPATVWALVPGVRFGAPDGFRSLKADLSIGVSLLVTVLAISFVVLTGRGDDGAGLLPQLSTPLAFIVSSEWAVLFGASVVNTFVTLIALVSAYFHFHRARRMSGAWRDV